METHKEERKRLVQESEQRPSPAVAQLKMLLTEEQEKSASLSEQLRSSRLEEEEEKRRMRRSIEEVRRKESKLEHKLHKMNSTHSHQVKGKNELPL